MMRFTTKIALLGLGMLGLTHVSTHAQINLTATAGTLAGTYTDLSAAFTAINAGTHQGAITINIAASYTEPGTAVLNSTGAGAASYTNVLIQPSVDGVVISGASASGRGLIELNGADNVVINGDNPNSAGTNRNLTITNTAANTVTFTSVIRVALSTLVTTADNNQFLNLILNGSATGLNISTASGTTSPAYNTFGILIGTGASTTTNTAAPSAITSVSTGVAAPVTASNVIIGNNAITNCGRGVSCNGTAATVFTGLIIAGNVIGNPVEGALDGVYSCGITIGGATAPAIVGNTIYAEGFLASSTQNMAGINIGNISANTTGALVERNVIGRVFNMDAGTWPAYGINLAGGANHVVQNNMIRTVKNSQTAGTGAFSTTFGAFGIRIASSTGHKIYHNSVHFTGTLPGAVSTNLVACLSVNGTTLTGLDIRNNIFSNQLTGGNPTLYNTVLTCVYLPSGATSALNLTLNNNAYYQGSGASNSIFQVSTTGSAANFYTAANFNPGATAPATNIRAYTSTLSAAGTNDNDSYASTNAPPFVSATDLHLNLSSPELINVEQQGAAGIVGVATDIDGDARPNASTTFPDMGCDEVAVAVCSAANGGTIAPAADTICVGGNINITATGASTGTGITYQWKVASVSGGPYANVTQGTGATTTSYNTGTMTAGTYYFIQQTTCSAGPITGNSNEFMLVVVPNPVVVATPDSSVYCGPGPGVNLMASGANTYAWSPSGSLSSATGDSVIASPAAGTTYVVTGTDGNGCIDTDTVFVAFAPSVNVSASANPTDICLNGSAVLNASGSINIPAYCIPVYSTGTQFGDYISNVLLDSINNSSVGVATAPYYINYPPAANTTTILTAGSTYTITITPGTYTSNDLAAWIDYNVNGSHGDAGEKLGEVDNVGAAPANAAITFTVPLTAYNGNTILRVRDMDHGTTNDMDPCAAQSAWGETEDYTVTIVGGVDPITYAWSPSTFLSTVTGDSIVADSISGPIDYYVVGTSAAGCMAMDTVQLVLSTVPPVAACHNITVSLDSTGTITVPATAVDSGSTDLCGIDSMMLDVPTFGCGQLGTNNVLLIVTNVNGYSDTCSAVITVENNLVPSASATASSTTICSGTSALLTGMGMGGVMPYAYAWSSGASTDTTTVSPTSATTYIVTVTDGCGNTDTASVSITVNPLPTAGFSFVNNGDGTVTFTNTATNASSYAWDFGNGTGTQSSPTFTVTYGVSNTFSVTQIVTNSCGSDTLTQSVTVTGVDNGLGTISSTVFPNPNRGTFFLSIEELEGQKVEITVTNLNGVRVFATSVDVTSNSHREQLDLTGFAKGLYFVRLESEFGFRVHKVTVQ